MVVVVVVEVGVCQFIIFAFVSHLVSQSLSYLECSISWFATMSFALQNPAAFDLLWKRIETLAILSGQDFSIDMEPNKSEL